MLIEFRPLTRPSINLKHASALLPAENINDVDLPIVSQQLSNIADDLSFLL